MIINRHNYEEFFLLYVDNELTPEDRAAVEHFVQQNPDVSEEMAMLKQSVLPEEKIAFEQKELLYNEESGINSHNYEEYFLLSVDKELTEQENEEVEKFVLKHPELQSEYILLEQTRLEPEALTFAGKEKLYRKEETRRRVIFVNLIRISAAAAIIAIAASTWFFTQNNHHSSGSGPTASSGKAVKILPQKIKPVEKVAVTKEAVATLHQKPEVKVAAEIKTRAVKAKEPHKGNNALAVNRVKNVRDQLVAPIEKSVRPDAATGQHNNNNMPDNPIASANTGNRNNLPVVNSDKTNATNATFANNGSDEVTAPLATHAVYREVDNQEEEEENTFYIGSAEINKNKLKGLFKKAAVFLGKKNNKNEGEKTLRIAGFEIKSK